MGTLLNYWNNFPSFLFLTDQNGDADAFPSASTHSQALTPRSLLKTRPNRCTKQFSYCIVDFPYVFPPSLGVDRMARKSNSTNSTTSPIDPLLTARYLHTPFPSPSGSTSTAGSGLGDYLERAGIEDASKDTPLFRSALGKQKQLSPRFLSANPMGLLLKRRLKDAGRAFPRSSAPTASTSWSSPTCSPRRCPLRTCSTWPATQTPGPPSGYDRRRRRVTRNIVERISV